MPALSSALAQDGMRAAASRPAQQVSPSRSRGGTQPSAPPHVCRARFARAAEEGLTLYADDMEEESHLFVAEHRGTSTLWNASFQKSSPGTASNGENFHRMVTNENARLMILNSVLKTRETSAIISPLVLHAKTSLRCLCVDQ